MRWRILESPPADGPRNMAVDVALMDWARASGESVLRVYTWSRPTVSVGRHEPAAARLDAQRLARAGIDVVRRPTGGRALWHEREVTYSIAAPEPQGERVPETVARLHQVVRAGLEALGVVVEAATDVPAERPDLPAPCFSTPAPGELLAHGRKLVASAQVREAGALLQHGSILLADDQRRLLEFASGPMAPAAPAASLEALLGRVVSVSEVAAALRLGLSRWCAGASERAPVAFADAALSGAALAALERHFRDATWTWRR